MDLLAMLAAAGGDKSVATVGKQLGLGGAETDSLLKSVAPALLRGLQNKTRDDSGVGALKRALESGNHQRYIDDPASVVSADAVRDGNGILGHIFGSKDVSRNVAANAAAETGIDAALIKKELPMLAGLAMGALNKNSDGGRSIGGQANASSLGPLAGALLAGDDGKVGVDDVLNLAKKFF
ncbi:MAG: DUF937 domain-containing protein [Pseudomonadota bacterium]